MKEPGSRYIAHRVEGTLAVMSPVTLYCPFRPLVLVSPPLSLRRSCRNVYGQTPSRQRDVHKFSLFATCWCLHGFSFLLTILTPTLMPAICHGKMPLFVNRILVTQKSKAETNCIGSVYQSFSSDTWPLSTILDLLDSMCMYNKTVNGRH